jgi:hypothetical protein
MASDEEWLTRLDEALARGIADADAGRVHPAEVVFRELRERIQRKLSKKEGGPAFADPPS